MAKLHELLAVEGSLKTQADKTRTELMGTFEKKRHLFQNKLSTFFPLEEGVPTVVEEQLDLQSTVAHELKWLTPFLSKAFDGAYQVDEGNTQARADVVLEDGTTLLENIPATYLLQLEKRVKDLHDFISSIPTLDPAKGFQIDQDTGWFKAREESRPRTKKVQRPLTLAPATDKHPAQVQLISEDVLVGNLKIQEWSGLITPAQKGVLLERVEDLARAVKRARSRANELDVDVQKKKVGDRLLSHVFKGYI